MDDTQQYTWSDAACSAPETAESSSSAPEASSSSGGRAKKRKVNEDPVLHGRVKRLRTFYNDKYRELFNETVVEISTGETPRPTKLLVSQTGATLWSSEEKEVLFCSLAKRGKRAIQDIAADVGSKSESEVYIYLESLQKAATDEQVYEPIKKLPKAFDITAAFEVSQYCCASLDVAAETLSLFQQQEEERIEKKKHGKLSLLTPKIAHWASGRLSAGEEGDREILEALPAAQLLNLKTFLTLSKRFFMNSSIMENNWRTYKERRKRPTITYTAFSDFHNLASSVTKRIVQSSLFFAMSRQRVLDASSSYKSGRHVKKADVMAALDVLGMESDHKNLWAGVARKCKLRVYEKMKHRRAFGKRYSYHEIEAILSFVPSKARGRSRAASIDYVNPSIPLGKDMPDSIPSHSPDDAESSDSLSTVDENSDDLSDSALSTNTTDDKQAINQKLREAAQEKYAEVLDQRASQAEERRLWELLGEASPERMGSEDMRLPKRPTSQRKDDEDLVDWKAWMNYATEWQVYETPVSAKSFTDNRSLRRRTEPAAGLTNPEMDSENVAVDSSSDPRSSRRNSSRRKPVSNEFSSDGFFNDHQSSGTEEKNSSVGYDDDHFSRKANGSGNSAGDELDEPEDDPQQPDPEHKISYVGESSERKQTSGDKGRLNSRPSISIASKPDTQDSENSADSMVTDE